MSRSRMSIEEAKDLLKKYERPGFREATENLDKWCKDWITRVLKDGNLTHEEFQSVCSRIQTPRCHCWVRASPTGEEN